MTIRERLSTPETFHRKNHRDLRPVDECWFCQRDRAVCRSKIRYEGWEEAQSTADAINVAEDYATPLTRYRCRWCTGWHLTKAANTHRRKRVEKQRRRHVARLAFEALAAPPAPGGGE